MTPNDLIKLALKDAGVIGVGQTPLAEDLNDAFTRLNMMLAGWARKRWLLFHQIEATCQGNRSPYYTVGRGGDFNIPRPTAISAAFLRLLPGGSGAQEGALATDDGIGLIMMDPDNRLMLSTNTENPTAVDVPLGIVRSYEDWSTIALKQQPGFPQFVFLDTAAPLSKLYVWPLPSNQYEIHIIVRAPLVAFDKPTQEITLPDEYHEALLYNLVGRLCVAYSKPVDPAVAALAAASLNTIRNANAQVPLLGMPAELVRGGTFNIYSGRYR